MTMITAAIRGLNDLGQLVPAVEALGRRRVGYGVKDEHYTTVGTALLWTLEKGLGPEFTPKVMEAWATTNGILASTMQNASKEAVAAA